MAVKLLLQKSLARWYANGQAIATAPGMMRAHDLPHDAMHPLQVGGDARECDHAVIWQCNDDRGMVSRAMIAL
jgi:hypothetical protein